MSFGSLVLPPVTSSASFSTIRDLLELAGA